MLQTAVILLALLDLVLSQMTPAASMASMYSMSTSTSLPFPSSTLSPENANAFISSSWSLSDGHIHGGNNTVAFVADPFPNATAPGTSGDASVNSTVPVMQVTYPAGSFTGEDGGAAFYSVWNSSSFQSMMVSYEVAFDEDFDWVKGGKLPGIRGGPNGAACDGGKHTNGSDCFSARLMWRKNGEGEVYAYIPETKSLCQQSGIRCNHHYGVSIHRGDFTFVSGSWNRVTLLVRLNNPPDIANGAISLYFNDVQAIKQENLQLRTSASVTTGGLFFSTFFGGNNASWATPNTTHSYFRNLQLWGSSAPSNLTGERIANRAARVHPTQSTPLMLIASMAATLACIHFVLALF